MLKLGGKLIFWIFRLTFMNRNNLVFENLALRQQLAVQQRSIKRPKLRYRDRLFWYMLSLLWTDWKSTILIVKPDLCQMASDMIQAVLALEIKIQAG